MSQSGCLIIYILKKALIQNEICLMHDAILDLLIVTLIDLVSQELLILFQNHFAHLLSFYLIRVKVNFLRSLYQQIELLLFLSVCFLYFAVMHLLEKELASAVKLILSVLLLLVKTFIDFPVVFLVGFFDLRFRNHSFVHKMNVFELVLNEFNAFISS